MAKWYDEWLTPQEKKSLQVGQKGIRARRRMKQDPENTRGYPKSGDQYQKEAAKNAGENRGYPHSGDEYQKKSASGKSSRFALMTAFKEEARKQLKKGK